MKRFLKILGLVVLALVAGIVVIVAVTFMGRQSITDGVEVNNVRIIKDGITSVGMFPVGDSRVGLVDAGTDAEGKAILAELARRKMGPDNVAVIFITHGHQDHTAALKKFSKAQIMALDLEVGRVEGTEGFHGPATRFMPVSPTGVKVARALHDGETVVVGQTPVRVFATPGHTGGSASYLVNGVLFLGDAADTDSNGKLAGSPWIFSDSQANDVASLVRLDQRLVQEHVDVKALDFAHSGVRTEGLAPLTAFAKNHQ
jgi:glyoxylase-like metal-dependent hydrolase (beta-lactamase superfamily II)